MKMEQTECPETSAYKIQTPGNYPAESTQHLIRLPKVYHRDRQSSYNHRQLNLADTRRTKQLCLGEGGVLGRAATKRNTLYIRSHIPVLEHAIFPDFEHPSIQHKTAKVHRFVPL